MSGNFNNYSNSSSDNQDYIPVSDSPTSTGNNNRGKNGRFNNFRRGFNQHRGSFNSGGSRNNFSPYNKEGGKNFHNGPRYDNKPKDISAYYHPSMMENPWARLEQKLEVNQNN